MKPRTLDQFHRALDGPARAICDLLRTEIDRALPEADARLWHAHPVWFLADNPITGYSSLKDGVRLLFWSGQGFESPGLTPQGKFKAAEARFRDVSEIDIDALRAWLAEAPNVQWDYANIVRRKGRLERLM